MPTPEGNPPPNPRITQKEIAAQAQVTQATVSLALANHPSIPKETCKQIQKIAQQLGYKTDPYLAGLSAYRRRIRPPHFQGTLAWLTNYPAEDSWKKSPVFYNYYLGALERAEQLGYQLKEYMLTSKGMTSSRMEKILIAQSISGILLPPQPHPGMHIDSTFSRFCVVTFGFTLESPRLHLVTLHQYRSMKTAFHNLLSRGYKRLGLYISEESDLRADRNWSAAFRNEQSLLPHNQRVPLGIPRELEKKKFIQWHKKYRPDVVVTIDRLIYRWMEEEGIRIPDETGFILLTIPDLSEPFSGIWENPRVIGAKAVEFLIDLLHRNEWGCPKVPLSMLVDGSWIDGKTVLHAPQHQTSPPIAGL